jgi:NAD(P)H-dependent nitrite reductase small subunit
MPKFVTVASVADVPPGTQKQVLIGDREVALFNVGGAYYAIDDYCPHQGGPLHEGWVQDSVVSCPWHGWCFDLRNGKMTLGDFAAVETFEVRVEGGSIAIADEPKEPAAS